jgi:hypothetical protein
LYSKENLKENIIKEFRDCANNSGIKDEGEKIDQNLSILQGLCLIVEESECSDLLFDLIDTSFPKWMDEIVHMSKPKSKITKWRIGLISLSVKECEVNVHAFQR